MYTMILPNCGQLEGLTNPDKNNLFEMLLGIYQEQIKIQHYSMQKKHFLFYCSPYFSCQITMHIHEKGKQKYYMNDSIFEEFKCKSSLTSHWILSYKIPLLHSDFGEQNYYWCILNLCDIRKMTNITTLKIISFPL